MSQNLFWYTLRYILAELIGQFFYFPVWWYTRGLLKTVEFCLEKTKEANDFLALTVWVKNIFRPMFAQYDWQGRLISFFVRLFQIMVRTLVFIIWFMVIWCWLLIWLALPPFIIWQIIYNLTFLV